MARPTSGTVWGVGYFEGIRRVTRKLNIQPNLKKPKTKKEKPDFKILSFKELGGGGCLSPDCERNRATLGYLELTF